MAITRREVQKFADEHHIELEITEFPRNYQNHGRGGINHVHAYSPDGFVFGGIEIHNLSVWDQDCADKIDWTEVLADLCDHMIVPCPDLLANGGCGCEVCEEDMVTFIEGVERDEVLLDDIKHAGGTV